MKDSEKLEELLKKVKNAQFLQNKDYEDLEIEISTVADKAKIDEMSNDIFESYWEVKSVLEKFISQMKEYDDYIDEQSLSEDYKFYERFPDNDSADREFAPDER